MSMFLKPFSFEPSQSFAYSRRSVNGCSMSGWKSEFEENWLKTRRSTTSLPNYVSRNTHTVCVCLHQACLINDMQEYPLVETGTWATRLTFPSFKSSYYLHYSQSQRLPVHTTQLWKAFRMPTSGRYCPCLCVWNGKNRTLVSDRGWGHPQGRNICNHNRLSSRDPYFRKTPGYLQRTRSICFQDTGQLVWKVRLLKDKEAGVQWKQLRNRPKCEVTGPDGRSLRRVSRAEVQVGSLAPIMVPRILSPLLSGS